MIPKSTVEHSGRVIRLRIDNAGRGNAFDDALLSALADAVEAAAATPGCELIRLDMAGPHFCGGWDTSTFAALGDASVERVAAALRASHEQLGRIRASPVPVVAAVRGSVVGFGAGLLEALHLPIAGTSTTLRLPEARFGFAPAGVGHAIARALPRARAYRLLTALGTADAAELAACGLVAEVVADDDLEAHVDAIVERLAGLPAGTLRAVVGVVESARETGSPDRAFALAAQTIRSAASRRPA